MSDPSPPGQPYPYGGQQPPYGGQQPPYGEPSPPYGGEQPPYGGSPAPQSPPYGQPQSPPYGQPQSPPYGQPQSPPYGQQPTPPYGQQPTPPYEQQPTPPYEQQPNSPYEQPQPGYGPPPQPTYGQPPYGAPPPPFGTPGPPYGAPPGAFPPAPPKKPRVGRTLSIIGASLAAVLVLCCGGAYFFGGRDIINESNASLSTPDTVAGLKKSTNPALKAIIDDAQTELKKEVDFDDTIAELYEDPKDPQKVVVLVGGTKLFLRPGSELDSAFKGFNDAGTTVKQVTAVDAGDLGGEARCGTVEEQGGAFSVCAWADHGSLVMGLFLGRQIEESAALLRQIRGEILQRD